MLHSGYRVGKPDGGPECEALERELEAYYGVPYARVFNSCTSALHSALVAVGIEGGGDHIGDEVLVPSYSMSASVSAALHAGAQIEFADIGDDYCMDWGQDVSDYSAVVLAHLFGHHRKVSWEIGTTFVHDCAQSPSLQPQADRIQDIWCYSFNQHKIVECGEGGYALTFDKRLADRLHAVRNHGECYTEDILGYNFRMTEMQAAIARKEFAQLDNRLTARRQWAKMAQAKYDLPSEPGNTDWFLYPIRCKPDKREELAKRIGGRVGYHKPIYQLPYFAKRYPGVHCPNAEKIESELVVVNPLESVL